MKRLRPEVGAVIGACEAMHALFAQGVMLTSDERDAMELSLIDLLSKLNPTVVSHLLGQSGPEPRPRL